MSLESDGRAVSCRKALKVAVCALSTEVGYEKAEDSALETLTEMLQGFLGELGKSAQSFAELAGRREGMMTDVFMALIEMGQNIEKIPAHARRANKSVFLPPSHSSAPPVIKTLQTGEKPQHLAHIPEHLPAFPDSHTFIRTQTKKAPINEYQIIREKAASQKRDVERALTRFIAKTGETQSLLKDDTNMFPLIAAKPLPLPYLNALLPKDQDLDAQEPVEEEPKVKKRRRDESEGDMMSGKEGETTGSGLDTSESDLIDNPYLRPVKMARLKKKIVIK